MKYCTNCGNQMRDDMLFCPKCGNKFEAPDGIAESDPRLASLREFNLVMDPAEVTWEYVHDLEGEDSAELTLAHDKMCQEYRASLSEIINGASTSEPGKTAAALHALEMSRDMLLSAKAMLEDIESLKKFKMVFVAAVAGGADLEFSEFPVLLSRADYPFYILSSINLIHVGAIARELPHSMVNGHPLCLRAAVECAKAFVAAWKALLARLEEYPTGLDVTRAPSTGQMEQIWDAYCALTEPLSISDVRAIDESTWSDSISLVKQWAECQGQPADEFANGMNRKIRQRLEQKAEREEASYWAEHPEKAEEKAALDNQLAVLSEELDVLLEHLGLEEAKKTKVTAEIERMRRGIEENKGNLQRYNIPIIYRRERKQWQREIDEWETRIPKLQAEAALHDEPIAIARAAVNDKEEEIAAVKDEVARLKNR